MLKAKLDAIANMKDMFKFENQRRKLEEKKYAKQTVLSYLKQLNRDTNSLSKSTVGKATTT